MNRRTISFFAAIIFAAAPLIAQRRKAENPVPAESPVAALTKGLKKYPGYFEFYYDSKEDKLLLLIDKWNTDFLYAESLTAAIGSNDIGIDRNQLGNQRIVQFERHGPRVFLNQPNQFYRAVSNNAAERKAVKESFAESVLFGFKVLAEEPNGNVLVDVTDFLLQDAHRIGASLSQSGEGNYSIDRSRCAFFTDGIKNFPLNSEFEATLTFAGEATGKYLGTVVPTPASISVRQHHSFVQLPDNQYSPRKFDPRSGFWNVSWYDYAKSFTEPLEQRMIARHRLKKKDPSAAMSEAVKPIIYYVDPGAPEPVRQALIEGAGWWNQAFEAAGYKNAFRVELLPEGADPMDLRYNIINWVHRSTRGWSYGASVTDPRTGEIIKGNVSLGSLRDRQDFLIAEGLLAPYGNGQPVPKALEEMTLQRLRQLSAHEVGHTLGLLHSYTSSTEDRASVMDYPQPLITMKDGKIDLSNAYDTRIGAWDKVAIAYGYQDYPAGTDEAKAGEEIIQRSLKAGLTFLSDQDARPSGSAHPFAHLWDNGKEVSDELTRMMEIRAAVLRNFGEKNIRQGAPMATLEEVLVPMYFYHRYQMEAAVKLIGGLNYRYAMRGDGQLTTEFVSPAQQQKALDAVLKTVSPAALALPENLIRMIPPRPAGFDRHRELIDGKTDLTFDDLGMAESAANLTFGLLLHAARANRLVEYHARDAQQPGLETIIERIVDATILASGKPGYEGMIQRTVNATMINNLAQLSLDANATAEVKAVVQFKLKQLKNRVAARITSGNDPNGNRNPEWAAHYSYVNTLIDHLENAPAQFKAEHLVQAPPGSPIGTDRDFCGN